MSDAPLAGRIALVTGGGRGIGRAISLALAEDGADIAINYARDLKAAEETAEAVRTLGRKSCVYCARVQDYEEDQVMVEAITADLGFVDILINNAGIASRGKSVVNTDPEELEQVIGIHALGPYYLAKLVIPGMREKERGDIVMISSVATLFHPAGGSPYNMGKAAQESLAYTLSKELKPHGIRVNIVAPGLVETEMGRRLMKAVAGVDDLRKLDSQMPFGRVCQPEDIANTVRFLVSANASYVTGEKLNVHGGGS